MKSKFMVFATYASLLSGAAWSDGHIVKDALTRNTYVCNRGDSEPEAYTYLKNGRYKKSNGLSGIYKLENGVIYTLLQDQLSFHGWIGADECKVIRLDDAGLICGGLHQAAAKCIAKSDARKSIAQGTSNRAFGDTALPRVEFKPITSKAGTAEVQRVYAGANAPYLKKQGEDALLNFLYPEYANERDVFKKKDLRGKLAQKAEMETSEAAKSRYYKFIGGNGVSFYVHKPIDVNTLTYNFDLPGRHDCLDGNLSPIPGDSGKVIRLMNLNFQNVCSVKISEQKMAQEIEKLRIGGRLSVVPIVYSYLIPQPESPEVLASILHVEYEFYEKSQKYGQPDRLIVRLSTRAE